jgi:pyruvate-ferredoxin/flavodoxin oxidoreductase
MPDDVWPTYDLKYVDEAGQEQVMSLPVTIADWAATEARFKKHFAPVPKDAGEDDLLRYDLYLAASLEERQGKTPFIYVQEEGRRLSKLSVSAEIVELGRDRLALWTQLKEMAGLALAPSVRSSLDSDLAAKLEERAGALKTEHDRTLADLKARYPALVARRLVEGLIRATGDGKESIGDLLRRVQEMPTLEPLKVEGDGNGHGGAAVLSAPAAPAAAAAAAVSAAPAAPAVAVAEEEGVALEPYIQSELCTACNECTNLNKKMFAYNAKKQAYIKDPRAGTFRELVMAAEKCPVAIIHPGVPLNPKEKDVDKWVKRAARFN